MKVGNPDSPENLRYTHTPKKVIAKASSALKATRQDSIPLIRQQ